MGTRYLDFCKTGKAKSWKLLFISSSVISAATIAGYFITLGSIANYGNEINLSYIQFFLAWIGVLLVALIGWRRSIKNKESPMKLLFLVLVIIDAALSFYIAGPMVYFKSETLKDMDKSRVRSLDLSKTGLIRFRYPRGIFLSNENVIEKVPILENFNQLNNRFHSRQNLTPLSTSWSDEEILVSSVIGEKSRIWFTQVVAKISRSDHCFMTFVNRSRELKAIPIVIHEPEGMKQMLRKGEVGANDQREAEMIKSLPAAARINVKLSRYSPTCLEFNVECPGRGWLLVTDRWSAGWQAFIDSEEIEVWGGNFIFRAIPVEKGFHKVEFQYKPFGYPWLVVLSWTMLMVVGIVSFIRTRVRTSSLREK